MNEQAYELTALAMRYWFTALILIACLCGLRLQIAQRRRARRERLAAPNMEYVGELLVVRGTQSVPRGERYAVQRDFVIGRRRKCDVCLADRSVFPRHARGELRNGGMLIGAIGRAPVALRGQPLSQEVLVRDGALFTIGALTLQLTLYDVPVEYEVGQRRAIDAADVRGDSFDEEAPFEHEFDDEYGPRDARPARADYADGLAGERDRDEDDYPSDEDDYPSDEDDYPSDEDDYPSDEDDYPSDEDDYPSDEDDYPAGEYDYSTDEYDYRSDAEGGAAPDAEYRRELAGRPARGDRPFEPIDLARAADDDDDYDALDGYAEYAREVGAVERDPRTADELEDYPGRRGARRRAPRAQGGAQPSEIDRATPAGRARRS